MNSMKMTTHIMTSCTQALDGPHPSGQDPFLESYRSTKIHNTMKEIKRKNNRKFKRNLKKEEWKAITTLRNNKDIVIKPADKGGNIVIMNKQDYLQEGLKQLSKRSHYQNWKKIQHKNRITTYIKYYNKLLT